MPSFICYSLTLRANHTLVSSTIVLPLCGVTYTKGIRQGIPGLQVSTTGSNSRSNFDPEMSYRDVYNSQMLPNYG